MYLVLNTFRFFIDCDIFYLEVLTTLKKQYKIRIEVENAVCMQPMWKKDKYRTGPVHAQKTRPSDVPTGSAAQPAC